MRDVLLFILGLAAGAGSHEAGHEITALTLGDEIHWRGTEWRCASECNRKAIAVGGFVPPAVASEVLLLKKRRGPFEAGWLTWNVLHPIAYTVQNEAFHDHGDFGNFSRGEARLVEAVIVGHAASVALRWAWKDKPEWLFVLPKKNGFVAGLSFHW